MGWRDDAACRGMNPDLFHPAWGAVPAVAVAACERCTVRDACLAAELDAMRVGHPSVGYTAGTTARERFRLLGQRGQRRPITHGTPAGYQAHQQRGETPCAACVEGMRADGRRRAADRRAAAMHGTWAGYMRHVDRGRPACPACTAVLAQGREYARAARAAALEESIALRDGLVGAA